MDEVTRELLIFCGIVAQASAVFWVWQDWQFGQYNRGDWRRSHRKSSTATTRRLDCLWAKFGGIADRKLTEFGDATAEDLTSLAKIFPRVSDERSLLDCKLVMINEQFGVGPNERKLQEIGVLLKHMASLKSGPAAFERSIRNSTFKTALALLVLGQVLQLVGSLPHHWVGT